MGAATRYMILIGLVAAVAACAPAENASIVSVPSAALVSVNGKTIGRTPAKYLFEFPEDFTRYTVRGSKAGYHDSVVVVSHNQLARSGRVRLRLEPQNIAATITSDPSEASVLIGETEIGQTPVQHSFNFSNRNHRYVVTASKPGFFDGTTTVSESRLKKSNSVALNLESHYKPVMISSEPRAANVRVDDKDVGRTPIEYAFNFAERERQYTVAISKPGFFDSDVSVSYGSEPVGEGKIDFTLEEDSAWLSTSESEATNRWLRIGVDPAIERDSAWQKLIDSVITVYDSLEQLDQTSGYLRSAPRIREYAKGPDGPFFVRTQFVGSISTLDPLTYKIKIASKMRKKWDAEESWRDFGRVFSEDAQLVEELQSRLGLK